MNAVAAALGIRLGDATPQAEGDLDFGETPGLIERYCVVYQTLAHSPALALARRTALGRAN